MKIRDLILAVLIIGMAISTGTLIAFASNGISDVKNITSEASSGELLDTASKNLESIAIGIRDSLDSQMQNQYDMVKTWANGPAILETAKKAQSYSVEELYEMWSAEATRKYNDGEAVGDGKPDNDLDPSVSKYLVNLSDSSDYPEIFITDYRGYAIAASGATGDFDQGPDDWKVILNGDVPVLQKDEPNESGEGWYQATNESPEGFYVSGVAYETSARAWGVEIVSQLRDPETNEYLGQIKAVFDYGKFINQFLEAENFDVFEIKVVDENGIIVATSLEVKLKVNNKASNIKEDLSLIGADWMKYGSITEPYLDENKSYVYVGFAMSNDINRHIVIVSEKDIYIEGPIKNFISNLQSAISEKSTTLQRNMIIIGVVVAIIIIVAAAFIMRAKVSIPLKKLTTVSDKLSNGEIEGLEIDVHGKDEISRFGESFKGVLAAFNFLKDEAENKK